MSNTLYYQNKPHLPEPVFDDTNHLVMTAFLVGLHISNVKIKEGGGINKFIFNKNSVDNVINQFRGPYRLSKKLMTNTLR